MFQKSHSRNDSDQYYSNVDLHAQTPIGPFAGSLNQEAVQNQKKIGASVSDTLVSQQWHLGFLGDLATIWKDYTGKSVSVGVYDSGVDKRLSAFDGRYDASKEVVIDGRQYDGGWRPVAGPHGTAVAGLIAAAKDGNETVGVAYGAKVTGVNIFDPYSGGKLDPGIFINAPDTTRFYKAMEQGAKFDIINNSWGPGAPVKAPDLNRMVEGSEAARTVAAITKIAAEGRDGLGTIAVKSAGNYGSIIVAEGTIVDPTNTFGVDGSIDSTGTDRHWLSIGAFRQADGNASSYSARGAHLLISAPSDDYLELGGTGIWTTDAKGREGYTLASDPGGEVDFTDSFGGTSAAAPIVSGVVALMLDANPDLGWRDVKNIIALSAKMPVKFETGVTNLTVDTDAGRATFYFNEDRFQITGSNGSHLVNNGGYHYSTDYGYGAINGFGAVRMAEVWNLFGNAKTSANEVNFSVSRQFSEALPDAVYEDGVLKPGAVEFKINVDKNVDIEHIDLVYDYVGSGLAYSFASSLLINIKSPEGLSYDVSTSALSFRYGENGTSIAEVLGLAGFRGEASRGEWTITIRDPSPTVTHTIQGLSLKFSGSEISNNNVYHITDEFGTMYDIRGEAAGRSLIDDINGGIDWIDMSALTGRGSVDLEDGTMFIGGRRITVQGGVENVVGGDGSNELYGDSSDNIFHGMRGNDVLSGAGGNDFLSGGLGNDVLRGGEGSDTFFFNVGVGTDRDEISDFTSQDWLVFDKRAFGDTGNGILNLTVDRVNEFLVNSYLRTDNVTFGGRIVFGEANIANLYLNKIINGNYYYAMLNATDDVVYFAGSKGADSIFGNALANTIDGNGGSDQLLGKDGDDTLVTISGVAAFKPDAGVDRIDGGSGSDTLLLGGFQSDYRLLTAEGRTFLVTARGSTEVSGIEQAGFFGSATQSWSSVLSGTTAFDAMSYIAGYSDLRAAYGTNAAAGVKHFAEWGFAEGRGLTFNALDYIASYSDLRAAYGTDVTAGAKHFIELGAAQGRATTFNGWAYLASYGDLIQAYGADETAAAKHFIQWGAKEGRATSFDALAYAATYADLAAAFGTDREALARHYVLFGYAEGRSPGAAVMSVATAVAASAPIEANVNAMAVTTAAVAAPAPSEAAIHDALPASVFVDPATGHADTIKFVGETWFGEIGIPHTNDMFVIA